MVIGIGGASRSGKSSLARQLAAEYKAAGKSVLVLDQDDFAFPEADLPRIRDRADWDQPASMDFRRLQEHIWAAWARYEVVLVEGILVFYDPEVNALFDRRSFLEFDKARFWERRKQETRWGEEPDWYLEHVWEAHLKYGRRNFENGRFPIEIRDSK